MQACRVFRNAARTSTSRVNPFSLANALQAFSTSHSVHNHVFEHAERVSVLLRGTLSLLPQTLSTADGTLGPESSLFWSNLLERSITELDSGSDQPSKAIIAVCGFDKRAGSHDLVTALLEDPFSSDPTYTDILRNRWKNAPSCVNIEHGKPSAFGGELSSPSDWLLRFLHRIQLTEFPDLSSLSGVSDEADNLLLNSNVLLLLFDPIVTPFSELTARAKHLLNKPNTVLVLTSGSISDLHRQSVSKTLSHLGCHPGRILFVDPRQALDAVNALQANPTSPSAIDRYQRDFLGSRISTITTAINEIISPESPSRTSLMHLREKTALGQVHGSLSASLRSVEATKQDMELVAGKVHDLSSEVQRIRDNARRDILGEPGENNKTEKALSLGVKEMSALLGSLTFWKMIWRVDEIGSLVSAAIQARWCEGLENQLILDTGRLESTKRQLSISAFNLISASSSDSLRSPVLENQMQQLQRLPTLVLMPNSLTQPIHNRRSQLIQHTTTKLHREAQTAVVGVFSSVLSGAGLGWWLTFGEHILSLGVSVDMGTAVGSGALLAMGGTRWAVGKWERAKQRWAQDSARIGEGLTRDLDGTIQRTVDDNVTIVASTACKGMQDLVERRRSDIRQLDEELSDLEAELHAISATWTSQIPPSKKEVDRE